MSCESASGFAADALAQSEALHRRVRAFIDDSEGDCFDTLARDIARYQRQQVPAVARLAAAMGASENAAAGLVAMPCDAFRARRIAAHPASCDERRFRTSGTTQAQQGEHPMRTTATYTHAALRWARHWLFPDTLELGMVVLAPHEKQAPHSSLSFMLARFADELRGPSSWHWRDDELDLASLRAAVASQQQPLLLAGTSFAFVHACDQLAADPLRLPPGSRVMQTGGFKGRSRSVDASVLRRAIAHGFGVPVSHIVGEYGMTELSSQLYQGCLRNALDLSAVVHVGSYHPPPWVRVDAVGPNSLEVLARGQVGICRVVDLANVDSSLAIQTNDRVMVLDDGSVELLGRQPGAVPRGCSLALEHLLS